MAEHSRFHIKDLNMLQSEAQKLGIKIPFQKQTDILFSPVKLKNDAVILNRFVVQPMEGFDADTKGTPGKLSFRRYQRYAAGGAGLIWFEACSVVPEGRSNQKQFYINHDNVQVFKQLVDSTKKAAKKAYEKNHKPLLVLQLTHSGRYSKPSGKAQPIIAHHSPILDAKHNLPVDYPLVTDEYLDKLQLKYVQAAKLAARAGFNGVDIKSCHGYLLSGLLAAHTRKNSRYGGSFENRTRMLLGICQKISQQVPEVFITTRLNVYDAIPYPYGFGTDNNGGVVCDLKEPLLLVDKLKDSGIPLLNHSIGNPYYEPHFGRPYDFPIKGMPLPSSHPLENVAMFLDITRQVQQHNPQLPVIGTGYSWLRQFIPNVAAGVISQKWATLIGLGRSSFAYPNSINDLKTRGYFDKTKTCVTCSACTQLMRDGSETGCVIRDKEIYGPKYRRARKQALDTLKAEAKRCRDCETAMCQLSCPADIDIPGFIKAFTENRIKDAYQLLKVKNYFPEICAYICPVEEQCEGACLEKILSDNPIPIHDIQRQVAQMAREMNLTNLKLGKANNLHVAIIGAGPAGLSCAASLLEKGFSVHIFDSAGKAGGTPNTIPDYRLHNEVISHEMNSIFVKAKQKKRLKYYFDDGLKPEKDISFFIDKYDGIFLGLGLVEIISLNKSKKKIQGLTDAINFLKQAKLNTDLKLPARVCVLGGGNTAIDAAITAKLRGVKDVYVIYRRSFQELPAWTRERNKALELGVQFLILTQPLCYITDGDKLTGIKVARTMLGCKDDSGRRQPVIIENSDAILPTDMVIEAFGQKPAANLKELLKGIKLDDKQRIIVDQKTMQTSMEKVFAGGDIVNGGATVVQAVVDGMKAARGLAQYLKNKK